MKLFKKIKHKEASALLIVIMIFFSIFIISFSSGSLVFLNIFRTSDIADNFKSYYAARSGVERAQFEALKNNYDFLGNCSESIFEYTLNNEAKYIVSCLDDNFYATGINKRSRVSLKIECINIEDPCLPNCPLGSLCGGGKLLKNGTTSIVIAPSACDDLVLSCDNTFTDPDFNLFTWDDGITFCNDLDFNEYSDWYLPDIDELGIIASSSAFNYYNISSAEYWSSTEEDATSSFMFDMDLGTTATSTKDSGAIIRCIRSAYP